MPERASWELLDFKADVWPSHAGPLRLHPPVTERAARTSLPRMKRRWAGFLLILAWSWTLIIILAYWIWTHAGL